MSIFVACIRKCPKLVHFLLGNCEHSGSPKTMMTTFDGPQMDRSYSNKHRKVLVLIPKEWRCCLVSFLGLIWPARVLSTCYWGLKFYGTLTVAPCEYSSLYRHYNRISWAVYEDLRLLRLSQTLQVCQLSNWPSIGSQCYTSSSHGIQYVSDFRIAIAQNRR